MIKVVRIAAVIVAGGMTTASPVIAQPPQDDARSQAPSSGLYGAFPYFEWPSNFAPQNAPVVADLNHFFFWTGKDLHEVEGRTFLVTLVRAGDGQFNEYLLKKAMHSQFARAGAVQITASRIPSETIRSIPEVDRQSLSAGMGDPYNNPVETWLIRRPDRQIWIHYTDNSSEASLAVVETDPANAGGDASH